MVASEEYDGQMRAEIASGFASITQVYEELAKADIRNAADVLRRTYDAFDGNDGYVSLEVSPYLAHDTEGTIAEARRLWRSVGRENLMIKVPGTEAGLPAIRQLIGEGINVNITLLFSQEVYERVVDAYLDGLETLAATGQRLDRMASVASFFVSRIDAAVEKAIAQRLAAGGSDAERLALEGLRGKIAIANAKMAYQRFLARFSGPRWERLAALGARPQKLLWASTGTKNPEYSDVLYVDTLIGPHTINTMPPKTLEAFRDHGEARLTLTDGLDDARATLAALERTGIRLERITADLATEGVRLFADAFDQLLGGLADKRRRMLGTALDGETMGLGGELAAELGQAQEAWRADGKVRRLWQRDAGLWTGDGEAEWLGWLDIVDGELSAVEDLEGLASGIRAENFSDALLLGMGGSSLGPEVIARTFGAAPGFPKLHVLDSTDPQQIRSFERGIDLAHTLFIVSSKSGTTLEPNILRDYFYARAADVVGSDEAGRRFIAITDPDSQLHQHAVKKGFRRVFLGMPSIGGRYSVLSNFGMVPAAIAGIDVRGFLEATQVMVRSCGPDVPPAGNPGVALGLAMGVCARHGRDKITIVASPAIAGFGTWAEQLIAEFDRQERQGPDPDRRRAFGTAIGLRQRSTFHLSAARRPRRRRPGPGPRCARASRPSGGTDRRREGRIARPGILPLGDGDGGRRRDARHQPIRPAGRRGEQDRDARADRGF